MQPSEIAMRLSEAQKRHRKTCGWPMAGIFTATDPLLIDCPEGALTPQACRMSVGNAKFAAELLDKGFPLKPAGELAMNLALHPAVRASLQEMKKDV